LVEGLSADTEVSGHLCLLAGPVKRTNVMAGSAPSIASSEIFLYAIFQPPPAGRNR
jgi:hypothetical protein